MYRPKYLIEIHKLPDHVKELYDVLAKKKIHWIKKLKNKKMLAVRGVIRVGILYICYEYL